VSSCGSDCASSSRWIAPLTPNPHPNPDPNPDPNPNPTPTPTVALTLTLTSVSLEVDARALAKMPAREVLWEQDAWNDLAKSLELNRRYTPL